MFENGSKKSPKKECRKKSAKSRGHSPLSIMPRVIPLVIKLGFVYLSFKRKAKKAGKIFKKELLAGGMDEKLAEQLTEEYLRSSHFLSGFDFSDLTKYDKQFM